MHKKEIYKFQDLFRKDSKLKEEKLDEVLDSLLIFISIRIFGGAHKSDSRFKIAGIGSC